ncbi:Uma2 family endonuclease [Streptomyces sp. NBC_01190]|uniref:Uma2 family endonuclease n=1 Tax=Streptomyces sp. NBC_01190 TaxID=2903767 RepID=UPI00386734F4|nr:Uma2 family endonuclease [Streptomyces sp. NBC_01190]
MTAIEDRPRMLAEEFEHIAAAAEREAVRLEFLGGKLLVKPVSDGDQGEIIRWVTEQCVQQRPDLWLYPGRGLKVEAYRQGHARPGGTLAPDGSFAGQGEWADAGQVLMTVEVTSYDSDTDKRDRQDKPRAYGETGIPVYLLIDRSLGEVVVYSDPEDGVHSHIDRHYFGKRVELPQPVGVTLETEPLKDWTR